jgi:hypothetical protein
MYSAEQYCLTMLTFLYLLYILLKNSKSICTIVHISKYATHIVGLTRILDAFVRQMYSRSRWWVLNFCLMNKTYIYRLLITNLRKSHVHTDWQVHFKVYQARTDTNAATLQSDLTTTVELLESLCSLRWHRPRQLGLLNRMIESRGQCASLVRLISVA